MKCRLEVGVTSENSDAVCFRDYKGIINVVLSTKKSKLGFSERGKQLESRRLRFLSLYFSAAEIFRFEKITDCVINKNVTSMYIVFY